MEIFEDFLSHKIYTTF